SLLAAHRLQLLLRAASDHPEPAARLHRLRPRLRLPRRDAALQQVRLADARLLRALSLRQGGSPAACAYAYEGPVRAIMTSPGLCSIRGTVDEEPDALGAGRGVRARWGGALRRVRDAQGP